ncbi:hypothetical protein [Leuconostoc fallax]|uniref:hypothetical protein n=1 Tax=Leuconostoc fallax TaxID=1251 RepID=UPI001058C8D7|nr:hypothetical protein [Leuconostoc fallax]
MRHIIQRSILAFIITLTISYILSTLFTSLFSFDRATIFTLIAINIVYTVSLFWEKRKQLILSSRHRSK